MTATTTIARTVATISSKRSITHRLLHQQQLRRSKSSIPSSSLSPLSPSDDEVYERALHNVTAFDTKYNLDSCAPIYNSNSTTYSSLLSQLPFTTSSDDNKQLGWRRRQMDITNANPIKPYPKSPPVSIRPSTKNPSTFFPPYAHTGSIPQNTSSLDTVLLHDHSSIQRMKYAAQTARQLLDYICSPSIVQVGTTTEQINKLLHNAALKAGAYPSPLNYMGFPKSVCSSINEVVCQ